MQIAGEGWIVQVRRGLRIQLKVVLASTKGTAKLTSFPNVVTATDMNTDAKQTTPSQYYTLKWRLYYLVIPYDEEFRSAIDIKKRYIRIKFKYKSTILSTSSVNKKCAAVVWHRLYLDES